MGSASSPRVFHDGNGKQLPFSDSSSSSASSSSYTSSSYSKTKRDVSYREFKKKTMNHGSGDRRGGLLLVQSGSRSKEQEGGGGGEEVECGSLGGESKKKNVGKEMNPPPRPDDYDYDDVDDDENGKKRILRMTSPSLQQITHQCGQVDQQQRQEEEADQVGVGSRSVRRRLVQSTLYHRCRRRHHHHPIPNYNREEENQDEEDEVDTKKRQQKKKRGREPKVAVNGKEPPSCKMGDTGSPLTAKSNFFVKISEKRPQKRQHKEQQCIDSPEKINTVCSPLDSAADTKSPWKLRKRQVRIMPVKNVGTNGLKKASLRKLSISPSCSDDAPQLIPNLRLEAKMIAEENSRIFAGKQMHPFFSSRKAGRIIQGTTELDTDLSLVFRKDKNIHFGPVHVFERFQDDVVSLDWRNWTLCEGNLFNCNCGLEDTFLSIFEDFVESLNFDSFLSGLGLDKPFVKNEVVLLDQCSNEKKDLPSVPAVLANGQMLCYQPLMDTKVVDVMNDAFSSGHAGGLNCSFVEQQCLSPQPGVMSNDLSHCNLLQGNLWTNKYLPQKALEVCGNAESVKFLSEWLRLWHERVSLTIKNSHSNDNSVMQYIDSDGDGSESDSENVNGDQLQNVLLVTGPVGSGKSAAIYACAKELGFQVIELNTSDWRNGALLKLKVGEAVESHSVKWSLENSAAGAQRMPSRKPIPGSSLFNCTTSKHHENEVVELIHLSEEEDPSEYALGVCGRRKFDCYRNDKTLLLFEDVDITCIEDRGFVAAIQHLAETTKQPMILTSNSDNPVLPDKLNRLHVAFTTPSLKELLCHLIMVCAAENADIPHHLIAEFIKCCQGDIRKTITHLQFWCQHRKGKQLHRTYSPLLFDVDAGHQILPKIIPCKCPSQLSQVVEKEISKSLPVFDVEEELVDVETQQGLEIRQSDIDSIEARKEAMLSRNCSGHDGVGDTAPFDTGSTGSEFSNLSGSPVAFTRRNFRRNVGMVLTSDSEDELCSDGFPLPLEYPSMENGAAVLHDVHRRFHSPLEGQKYPPSTSHPLHCNGETLEKSLFHCSGTSDGRNKNYTCNSVDISFVPESSFVPETEINDGKEQTPGTVFCSRYVNIGEADSLSRQSIQNQSNFDTKNLDEYLPGLLRRKSEITGSTSEITTDLFNGEVVMDSQNEHVEAATRGFQMMDECSRMDFNGKSKSINNSKPQDMTDPVQETWRKLRDCHADFRQYVMSEENDHSQVVNLAYQMTSLISEVDILLSDCQLLLQDTLELPMVPSEDSHAFSGHDQQLHMTSSLAEHGFCFYAKNIAAVKCLDRDEQGLDLTQEMLASATNTMALGKLVGHTTGTSSTIYNGRCFEMRQPTTSTSLKCKFVSCIQSKIQSMAPSKSYFALKGAAAHEYLSALGRISRSETKRLSKGANKTKRRSRVSQHYLCDGAMALSLADISLLGQRICYGKNSSPSQDSDRNS